MEINQLTEKIIGCAIEVHRNLGPGLLESTYEACLAYELSSASIPYERQKTLPVVYKGNLLDCGYRLDLFVDNRVIVEIKASEAINDVHEAQVITYLKLSKCQVGLIVNFNVKILIRGIKRVVYHFDETSAPLRSLRLNLESYE